MAPHAGCRHHGRALDPRPRFEPPIAGPDFRRGSAGLRRMLRPSGHCVPRESVGALFSLRAVGMRPAVDRGNGVSSRRDFPPHGGLSD